MVSSNFIQCIGIGKNKVKAIEKHYRNSWMEPQVLYIRSKRDFQNVLHHMTTSEPEITVLKKVSKQTQTLLHYNVLLFIFFL